MTQKLETNHIIRFPDCDPFNHLNNGKYIDYFINAREDHLKIFYDFDIYKHAMKTGESWVVSENRIVYLSPALLMEEVCIQSLLLEWNAKDTLVEMQMWNKEKNILKSVLRTKFIHFNIVTKLKIEHSDYLKKKFKLNKDDFNKSLSFEERLIEIRKNKKSI